MNALKLLTNDHRKHEELLQAGNIRKNYDELREELIRHVHIEEEIFYPRLFEIPELKEAVALALEEHTICMQLLQELDDQELSETARSAKLKILTELLLSHEAKEEKELFPLVSELASHEYLNEVGTQMRIQKEETDPEEVLYPDPDEEKFYTKVRTNQPSSP
ncbi:MAG: hemerythrin domain-containing protein [Bdellovibrionota bacterium]